jgi:hypothetical protein
VLRLDERSHELRGADYNRVNPLPIMLPVGNHSLQDSANPRKHVISGFAF